MEPKEQLMSKEHRIIEVLDQIRPALHADGGDVEFLGFDEAEGIVHLRLMGACESCPISIEAVLERHDLAVVAETASDHFELMGSGSEGERRLWMRLEQSGWVRASQVGRLLEETGGQKNLEVLIERHLLFRHPLQGDLHALSTLIQRPA